MNIAQLGSGLENDQTIGTYKAEPPKKNDNAARSIDGVVALQAEHHPIVLGSNEIPVLGEIDSQVHPLAKIRKANLALQIVRVDTCKANSPKTLLRDLVVLRE